MGNLKDNLIPGKWYTIEISDCCVAGQLIGQFFWYYDDDYSEERGISLSATIESEYSAALFNIGLLEPISGSGWTVKEIGGSND